MLLHTFGHFCIERTQKITNELQMTVTHPNTPEATPKNDPKLGKIGPKMTLRCGKQMTPKQPQNYAQLIRKWP